MRATALDAKPAHAEEECEMAVSLGRMVMR
jgi:hypothetical protein